MSAIVLISLVSTLLAAPAAAGEIDAAGLYAAKCAACHAKDGRGNPALTKPLNVKAEALSLVTAASLKKPRAQLVKVTSDGSGKMPAFKGKLTSQEIEAVVTYARSLAGPKS